MLLLRNELGKEVRHQPSIKFSCLDKLNAESFNDEVYSQTAEYIDALNDLYQAQFMKANSERERKINYYLENQRDIYNNLKNDYYNEAVSDVVTKTFDKNKILRDGDRLIQIKDPIYQMPEPEGILRFRSQFFSPMKYFFGFYIETLWFNIIAVWVITAVLYAILYYDLARRAFESISDIDFKKKLAPLTALLEKIKPARKPVAAKDKTK